MNARERATGNGNDSKRSGRMAAMPYYKPATEKLARLLKKEGIHVC